MSEKTDNLVLEHLKSIRADQSSHDRKFDEILSRLAHLETMVARQGRDLAELVSMRVEDRHSVDGLRQRIERIERRLELVD